MTATKKDPVLVVLQLTGGNDYMNTVIPHADPLYRDNRPVVGVADDRIVKLNDQIGLHPEVAPLKRFWDSGDMAIIHGVGYANSPRSHFRSMDIWHTCEPDKLGTEGWLGRATRDIDPNKNNVVTAVSFGPSLPRALALPGVPVACVDDLDNFGMLTSIQEEMQRDKIINRFTRLYSPTIGSGFVMDYLGQTGLDSLKAADILNVAPGRYSSSVEYPDTPIARKLKGISQVHQANLGARVLYCDHGSFDSHSNQVGMHDGLWKDVFRRRVQLLRRPARKRRQRQRHPVDVLRVWPPGSRQRQRHRPRRRRPGVRHGRRHQGRRVRRIPVLPA